MIALLSLDTLDYKETDMKNAKLIKRNPLSEQPSPNSGPGFRRIEVTTDYELHLHHPAGYRAREEAHSQR